MKEFGPQGRFPGASLRSATALYGSYGLPKRPWCTMECFFATEILFMVSYFTTNVVILRIP